MENNNIIDVNEADFETKVLEESSNRLVVVDFWAPWCGPCRLVGPIIEDIANDFEGQIKVGKLNVDDNQQTAMGFRVMSIPTVILFKEGEPVETMIGAQSKSAYLGKIEAHLAKAT